MTEKQKNQLDYVDEAENVIKSIQVKKRNGDFMISLTTSKIRNILSMVSEIYNEVIHELGEKLSEKSQSRIQYLRLRIVYEAGRDKDVRNFVDKAKLLIKIKSIGADKEKFLRFCNYMEALVAYHRYYGGKE